MKYFIQHWHSGDITDEESDAVVAAYAKHRAALLPKMPPAIKELATATNIHDGLLELAMFDKSAQQLHLEFIIGDLQQGYSHVHLCYSGTKFESTVLAAIAYDSESEALYDEIDIQLDGNFEHRILFWPYRELVISFRSLSLTQLPRADRKRANVPNRFIEK